MSLVKAAGIIAIISLLSKFVGLFREIIVSAFYGTGFVRDAYGISSLLPASFALIMLAGLNGPFHSSIVSVISKYKSEKKEQDIKTTVFTVSILSVILMGIFSFLCYEFAPYIIDLCTTKEIRTEVRDLAVHQLQIMSPMFMLSALIGISYGILNIEKVYLTPSLSPSLASLSVIAAIYLSNDETRPVALAWGTMIGAILQLLLQIIPSYSKLKNYIGVSFKPSHQGVKDTFSILFPASMSSTVGQINLLIMTYFASGLPEVIGANTNANYIYQLPLGIMLTALLVPLLPMLNESYIKNDDHKSFKDNINKGLRSIIFVCVPSTIILALSGKHIIQVMFQRGAFNAHSTELTYLCLLGLTISLIFYAFRDLLVRVFYAMNNAKIPFYTSIFSIVSISLFSWLFIKYLNIGVIGLTLAVSTVTIINTFILAGILSYKLGNWINKETINHTGKVLLASIPLTAYCLGFNFLYPNEINMFTFGVFGVLLGIIGIFCIFLLRVLKDSETIAITDKIIGRFKRKTA